MLVDSDGELLLSLFLADDVIIEEGFDLDRCGQRRAAGGGLLLLIIGDDLVADIDALIANINGRPGNQLLDFVLRFAAERTAQCVVASSHPLSNPSRRSCSLRLANGGD